VLSRVARTPAGVLALSGTRANDMVRLTLAGTTYEFYARPALRAGPGTP
jgi:hypothetical protein